MICSNKHIIFFLFIFLTLHACKEEPALTVPNVTFKEEYFYPFNEVVDNNDLECNYYFNEDVNDAINFISDKITDENKYSLDQMKDFLFPHLMFTFSNNSQFQKRVDRVMIRLVAASENINECKCTVVDAPYMNAFMILDEVFITTGLLHELKNDDELAIVLGHEMGHVSNHIKIQSNLIASVMDIYEKSFGVGDIMSLLMQSLFSFSAKSGEIEADVSGLYLMTKAGYDPKKGIEVFRRVLYYHTPPNSYTDRVHDEINSSHPYSVDRYNCLLGKVLKYGIFPDSIHLSKLDGAEGQIVAYEAEINSSPTEAADKINTLKKGELVNVWYKYKHDNKSASPDAIWVYVLTTGGTSGWINDNYVKYENNENE